MTPNINGTMVCDPFCLFVALIIVEKVAFCQSVMCRARAPRSMAAACNLSRSNSSRISSSIRASDLAIVFSIIAGKDG